jgi:UDP-N-acetylmuramoyl-L-alanyl-D-glutamate--2,6-diaminopimelate ligase
LILGKILTSDSILTGDRNRDITGITYDSRAVKDGFLFVAVKGEKVDGHNYIEGAIAKGAAAVVCEKGHPMFQVLIKGYPLVSWVGVEDCRDALAAFSSLFYGSPSEKTGIIGITGTNGKTSVSYLIKSVLETWNRRVGLIGTIRYMIGDQCFDAPHTTPEASDFQNLLGQMVEKGCDYVVTEVSSHALAQKRTDHTQFRVAIFTNLTGDHLDYHGTMEGYFESKIRLFTELLADSGTAVINFDDPYGKKLSAMLSESRPSVRQITFSLSDRAADVTTEDIRLTFRGTHFSMKMKGNAPGMEISTPLVGETGIYNVLSAVCAAMALDVPTEVIRDGIAAVEMVKGRFERVDCGQPFLAVVDYAHTHDALERLIGTSRHLLDASARAGKKAAQAGQSGKIITVFGCGGNRDRLKRPKMGRIATDLSDFVIITTDNPRNEESIAIIRDIEAGIEKDDYIIIQDRYIAIKMAVLLASPGDIVIVAGKGHEDYQEICGQRYPFSDSRALEEAIAECSLVTERVRARKVMFRSAQC